MLHVLVGSSFLLLSFILLCVYLSVVCILQFVYPSFDGHLGCFWFGVIVCIFKKLL